MIVKWKTGVWKQRQNQRGKKSGSAMASRRAAPTADCSGGGRCRRSTSHCRSALAFFRLTAHCRCTWAASQVSSERLNHSSTAGASIWLWCHCPRTGWYPSTHWKSERLVEEWQGACSFMWTEPNEPAHWKDSNCPSLIVIKLHLNDNTHRATHLVKGTGL